MDTGSFMVYIETETNHIDIEEAVEKTFETSNYEVHRPLLIAKRKK